MARALIKINGTDSQFTTVAIGSTVNLSNHDEGGEVSYGWQIVDQPEGTADVLSATGVENVSFTPTKEGSYLLKLTVNAVLSTVSVQTAIVAVLEARTGDRIPAGAEVLETGLTGWAPAVKRILSRTLHATVDANLIIAQTPGGISPGGLVTLTGTAIMNPGSQSAFTVTQLAAATAATQHRERIGILIDGVAAGITTASALVLVRIFGLVPFVGTGSPAVGDRIFLSNTGTAALTPGTVPRTIGYVVASSAGSYQWVIDAGLGAVLPGVFLGRQRLTASSGTYTPTPGTAFLIASELAGGGGGGGAVGSHAAGGGGCSGTLLRFQVGAFGGTPITGGAYANGAGGAGGSAAGGGGGSGGDTTIVINGTTFTAKGGGGGGGMTASTDNLSTSNPPAAGTSAGDSGYHLGQKGIVGGGGITWESGAGGSIAPFGGGGKGIGGSNVGNPGTGTGAGGGGAASNSGTGNVGGAGTIGEIIIEEWA